MAPPRKHVPSSIDRLPHELRELIGRLRDQGATIDQIKAKLDELDAEVSRSALGRHIKGLAEIGAQMRRSREIATALVGQFGEESDNRVARVNIEMMHGVVMRLLTGEDENGELGAVTLDAEEVLQLSRSLQSLAGADKTNAERTLRLKAEFQKEAIKKLDEAVQSGDAKEEAMREAKRILFG
ncbi:phage protein Gp27 family protein [Brevundimonas faecalis]|uniref:phage protein Gp27 family protein n=1 Tax=Brevundimonas faecalis TaxID=947378 RepID=UPI0036180B9D